MMCAISFEYKTDILVSICEQVAWSQCWKIIRKQFRMHILQLKN